MVVNLEVEIRETGVADAVRQVIANFYYYGPGLRQAGGLAALLEREVVHSYQLVAVLAALPRRALAAAIGILLADQAPVRTAKVVSIHFWRDARRDGEQLCEPDFAVSFPDCLVLGEVKTNPKRRKAQASYSAAQLLNYLSLVEKLGKARPRDDCYPTRFAHLIVLPSMDLRWFKQGKRWLSLPSAHGGRAEIDVTSCYALASKERNQRYLKSPTALGEALARVPVICQTWAAVTSAVERAAGQTRHEECGRFALEIEAVASAATAGL